MYDKKQMQFPIWTVVCGVAMAGCGSVYASGDISVFSNLLTHPHRICDDNIKNKFFLHKMPEY
ncbi:MAG: hypothetical protein AB7F23_08070 [Phycisphaerae bacterium]|jgi:hypothetical protein